MYNLCRYKNVMISVHVGMDHYIFFDGVFGSYQSEPAQDKEEKGILYLAKHAKDTKGANEGKIVCLI